MLKTRVIPTLLWNGNSLVKGEGFDSWRTVGALIPAIRVFNLRDVDELMLLDINATNANQDVDLSTVKDAAEVCSVPFTVGGGISSVETIKGLLHSGADKVAINSALYSNLDLLSEAAYRFGAQCIVASVDVRKNPDGQYVCYSHNGQKDTGLNPFEWVKKLEENGAGEILINSIELDGTMNGYDINLIETITDLVNIPVIASGGAGKYSDFVDAVNVGQASAVAAGAMFQFTEQTPREAKNAMAENGIQVRTNNILGMV
ncbi:imidazole glycerol phosphate synthase subunit HisF [Curvivirga sp.]|uniref:imidazole glycerol phosphate synthase subunit HisF n=1 Tax=Curvivirga sp. TaxID=2856848 RepID=UPI003B5C7F94